MEHRCGHRMHLNQSVRVAISGGPFGIARLRDISASGAFIATARVARELTRVHVRLALRRNGHSLDCTLQGLVIRETEDGIGIEWLEFSPSVMRQLEAVPAPEVHTEPSVTRLKALG